MSYARVEDEKQTILRVLGEGYKGGAILIQRFPMTMEASCLMRRRF